MERQEPEMKREASILALALNLLAGGVVPGMVALPAKAAEETPQTAPDMKEKCAAMMEHASKHQAEKKHDGHGKDKHMGAMDGCDMMKKSDAAPQPPSEGQHQH